MDNTKRITKHLVHHILCFILCINLIQCQKMDENLEFHVEISQHQATNMKSHQYLTK